MTDLSPQAQTQQAHGTYADRTPEILRYIRDTIADRGYPPTRREIGELIGRASRAEAGQRAIRRLVDDGLIELVGTPARGMRITKAGMKAMTEGVA